MMLETAFVLLTGLAIRKNWQRDKLTKEEELMFHEALANLRGPSAVEGFRKLAEGLRKFNKPTYAAILDRRADYLDAPEADKKTREAIFQRAMASTKPEGIRQVASWFRYHTATGVARTLEDHAKAVEEGRFPPKPQDESAAVPSRTATNAEPEAPAPAPEPPSA